jgi:hypothetical protein
MLATFKITIQDVLAFVKEPKDSQAPDQSFKNKVRQLIFILLIDLVLSHVIGFIINTLVNLGWASIDDHAISVLLETMSIPLIVLILIVAVPFIEEIIFRLPLTFKRNYLLKFFIAVFPVLKGFVINFWNSGYVYVFYLATSLFAFLHIFNFDMSQNSIYVLPLLILPQFFMGLLAGYLRVRYNFMLCFLLHVLHNSVFIGYLIWSMKL